MDGTFPFLDLDAALVDSIVRELFKRAVPVPRTADQEWFDGEEAEEEESKNPALQNLNS